MKLDGKNVLVFGSGISGIGAADLLKKVGANPVIYDGNENLNPEDIRERLQDGNGVSVVLGELPARLMEQLDLVVLSPGVPTDLPLVNQLREKGLTIWGEVELAYQMGKGRDRKSVV